MLNDEIIEIEKDDLEVVYTTNGVYLRLSSIDWYRVHELDKISEEGEKLDYLENKYKEKKEKVAKK